MRHSSLLFFFFFKYFLFLNFQKLRFKLRGLIGLQKNQKIRSSDLSHGMELKELGSWDTHGVGHGPSWVVWAFELSLLIYVYGLDSSCNGLCTGLEFVPIDQPFRSFLSSRVLDD